MIAWAIKKKYKLLHCLMNSQLPMLNRYQLLQKIPILPIRYLSDYLCPITNANSRLA